MPGIGRYPCTSCHYVASNRRMLARHSALIHCDKVFKCPVCPFITRYAANWYRHKRDQHGLSKLTTCDDCGFSANSPPELAQHREAEHPDVLQLEKYEDKYAKEKIQLNAGSDNKLSEIGVSDKDLKNDSDLLLDIYDIDQEIDINLPPNGDDVNDESVKFSSTFNGHFGTDFAEGDPGGVFKDSSPEIGLGMNDMDTSSDNLRPLRIRRSYNCDQCGLLTNNPREYLYHLRNIHGEKIQVHECKYCIYASKHIQKLQRHCNLVHRQQLENDFDYKRLLESTKDKKPRSDFMTMGMPLSHSPSNETFQNSGMVAPNIGPNRHPIKNKPQINIFKCSICTYQTRNKSLMFHHDKTAHLKKKNFRCGECGYITNDKNRFSKHIKYHNLPKLQCQYCFFKTAYKWNMERHMKNHEVGAEGNFHCNECNFTTSTKQSYNAHITNHHDPCAQTLEEQDIQALNAEDDSNEWEDISGHENEDESNDGNFDSYEFSEISENPENSWNNTKGYERNLKCQQCDFRAAWPFELKKHEENHKSQKKHSCPLCGMRFEHIAWLIKHLKKIHGENAQAKSIAAAFDLLKPARRRPGKEYASDQILPMFQDVLKQQNNVIGCNNGNNNNKTSDQNKGSMLSTLLKKPMHPYPPSSVSKYSAPYKSKNFNSSSSFCKQPRISNYYQKVPSQEPSDTTGINSKKVPTCNVCGYRTRWISELQRHMRVHSQEKPFQCHKCKYVCKWKGDLNRHLIKYHGIKMPTKRTESPKLSKKSDDSPDSSNDWQGAGAAKRNLFPSGASARSSQDSPLDLTLGRETFPHPNAVPSPYDAYDFDSHLAMDTEPDNVDVMSLDNSPMMYTDFKSHMSRSNVTENSKLKYQCPQCTFNTTTASRFHVHIVQHYNKRPFMCSVCGYNSNWEFDITKHIRLKGKDKEHKSACVLLTDESGRRNYDKYEKYLVDVTQPIPVNFPTCLPELNGMQDNTPKFNLPKQPSYSESPNPPNYCESLNKNCSYDFRNIGSNFEDSPINIVVTPDINLPDPSPETEEMQCNYVNNLPEPIDNANITNPNETKYFYCKHCNFKHSTKRVVVSHLSSHTGLKPFRCRACGLVSNWRHVIVRHVKDVHNGYMNEVEERINFVQEGYALRLLSFNADNEHPSEILDTSSELFGCKICPYKCDKEFYMNFHMKQHRPREGAIFKCDYCPYFVKFKKTLVRHMKLHNPDVLSNNIDINSSNDCIQNLPQEYSNDIYDFYDSQQNESNDESIAISFNQLSQVDPNDSPAKIKRHLCEHCPYKTDNKTQYLYHKQFHRPNPSAPFKCNDCSYWASMQHLMTQHMKVHSDSNSENNCSPKNDGPKQYFEFFDDKNVPETISVIYVKKGEENVKMFKCEFCPMMNKKKANVRVHQKMHGVVINDGRFACVYCNYQCLNQGGLTNHMKVHQKPGDEREFSPSKFYESLFDDDGVPVRKPTKSYFCYKCPGIFRTANDLEKHSKFHGSTLPLKCTYCDYRVKQKPHITQHLAVHTAEYKAKRKAATALNPLSSSATSELEEPVRNRAGEVVPFKKIDQMLLLEASELKAALNKTGEAAANLHKCILCPAFFCKTAILVYHVSLHGSDGEFKCTQCDYAVSRLENLHIHNKLHPKKSPVKRTIKSFACHKCPAVFYKLDRYDRHMDLHGKGYRVACDQCDYSVRFAANIIKHKKIHAAHPDFVPSENPIVPNDVTNQLIQDQVLLTENTNFLNIEEKKVVYICDRCPYTQARKDAVQAHQRRHWLTDGSFQCPYCDYSSMQNSFLQSHIKLHIQPNNLFPPQAFMKFQSFKIYVREENNETLLFDDEEMVNETVESIVEAEESEENKEEIMLGKTNVPKKEKDFKNINIEKEETEVKDIEEDANLAVPEEVPKFYIDNREHFHTDSNFSTLSSSSSKSNKVPIVVLNDIFANEKDLKKWGNRLKIPKLKIRKCAHSSSSERSSKKLKISDNSRNEESSKTKKSKPSLVVKIKVENCRINKHEKTLYSVSTKSSDEPSLKERENSLGSAENTNDSASDINFPDSEASIPTATSISPVDDIEENTLTSNPDVEDALKASDSSIGDAVDSAVGSATNDLVLPQSLDENIDLKSNDSFSNDTVPVVSDILCDKLDCLTELSFKDSDLSLTNGDCSNHLSTSGLNLLPEEIKVGL